jgi:hypothetical protein
MSDVYATYEPEIERPRRGSEGPEPTWMEGIGAAFRLGTDTQDIQQADRLANAYLGLDRDLQRLGVPRERLWRQGATDPSVMAYSMGGAPGASIALDRDAVWQEIARARAADPRAFASLPASREEYDQQVLRRFGERDRDQRTAGRAGLAANLIGGFAGAMTDPINILTLPIGGGGKSLAGIFAREALINGAIEAAQSPQFVENSAALGEDVGAGDVAFNVGLAALGGGVLGAGGTLLARGTDRLGSAAVERFVPADRRIAAALARAEIDPDAMFDVALARGVFGEADDAELVDIVSLLRGGEPSPLESAAGVVVSRQAEIDAVNPYAGGAGANAHADRLQDAISRVLADMPPVDYDAAARRSLPVVRSPSPGADVSRSTSPSAGASGEGGGDDYFAQLARVESSNNPNARASTSSASGLFQFTEGTFKSYHRRVFGSSAADASRAWQNNRFDPALQRHLVEALTADTDAMLRRAGQATTNGNRYLGHFLGVGTAERLLRAAPDTPVSQILSGQAIAANRSILAGKSASEVIAWAHRKMGGSSASIPAGGGRASVPDDLDSAAILRDEAFALRREAAEMPGVGTMHSERFAPGDIAVDAALMQFKGGGDARGVTDRLQGVETWNPILAGRAIVWEAADGRRLIADGHQRLGLAQRIAAADPAQNPMIDAIVLREGEGWDAESVRTWAALKNIAEGSGTPVDAAKIFRSMGEDASARYLPPRSALVRDAGGLARLGDDAFGAVVNELVDPGHAAIVGRLSRDPGEQKALVDLLIRLQPRTLGEADGVVRQGLAAGFTRETQEGFDFGTSESTVSLMIERARVLDRGLAEMRKMRQVFGTAADNADTLASAGNRIDVDASKQEAIDNAQAIDIVARLAWRAGPVKDAIDAAARALADGGRIGDVTKGFVRDVRKLDVAALVRADGESAPLARSGDDPGDGFVSDGSGRIGDADGAASGLSPVRGYSDQPDLADNAWPSRAEIEDAGQTGFALFDEPALRGFEEPDAPAAAAQTHSIDHDLRLIAEDADLPMFRIGDDDDAVETSLGDLLDGFDRADAAVEAARKCL